MFGFSQTLESKKLPLTPQWPSLLLHSRKEVFCPLSGYETVSAVHQAAECLEHCAGSATFRSTHIAGQS